MVFTYKQNETHGWIKRMCLHVNPLVSDVIHLHSQETENLDYKKAATKTNRLISSLDEASASNFILGMIFYFIEKRVSKDFFEVFLK